MENKTLAFKIKYLVIFEEQPLDIPTPSFTIYSDLNLATPGYKPSLVLFRSKKNVSYFLFKMSDALVFNVVNEAS